jgi:hypothetical protein
MLTYDHLEDYSNMLRLFLVAMLREYYNNYTGLIAYRHLKARIII